ncbi:MAG: NADH-quinone oxidoreductase subunit A [Methanomassiliicoccales archaeon]
MMTYSPYLPVLIFAVICTLFVLFGLFISAVLRPTKKEPLKETTYECGEVPIGDTRIQFHFQYYMFALIFVIADVLTVFLALWIFYFAPHFTPENILMFVFTGILVIGVLYALKKEEVIWI